MEQVQKDFQALHHISYHTKTLQGIQSLLNWDQETYMPSMGYGIRAEQIKVLTGIVHKEKTSRKFVTALSKLLDIKSGKILQKGLSLPQKAALREWRRDYIRETALPSKFVEEFARLSSEAMHIWAKAKKNNNFKEFLPYLQKIVDMCRKKADYIGYKEHPYDALIEQFEHDITTKEVKVLFHSLQKSTTKILKHITSSKQVKDHFLIGSYSESKQRSFGQKLLTILDYPATHGRLDLSAHPFCSSSHPTDCRITTGIHPKMPMSNIRSVLHESGHAFYEMGLPVEHYGNPLGESISLGIHESQSRWWETRIGMSKPFWKYCLPIMKQHFKGKLDRIPLDTFWRAISKVEPSMIRVEADEVTYSLHVILRFELELALIEGTLSPKELPEAWNEKMHQLLGITPANDAEGCLQDVHWSMGAFGYFPTYTLGNLYAAHLFDSFEKTFPDWEKQVGRGKLSFIREWQKENIHQHGRRYNSKELLEKIAGKPFSSKAFEKYLSAKYSEIYGLILNIPN